MWGKGLTTEALSACLDWIFIKPEISRVYAVTDKEDTASRRVMEKLGMKHEKDVDLYGSVAEGYGLLPFYSIDRGAYLGNVRKVVYKNSYRKTESLKILESVGIQVSQYKVQE